MNASRLRMGSTQCRQTLICTVDRQLTQMQIEEQALMKRKRMPHQRSDMALREKCHNARKSDGMKANWQNEHSAIDKVRSLKRKWKTLYADGSGYARRDLARASWPVQHNSELQRQYDEAEHFSPSRRDGELLKEEVPRMNCRGGFFVDRRARIR